MDLHLSDRNHRAKSNGGDIRCTPEARLVGRDSIVAKDDADNPQQAIECAIRKLIRALSLVADAHHIVAQQLLLVVACRQQRAQPVT